MKSTNGLVRELKRGAFLLVNIDQLKSTHLYSSVLRLLYFVHDRHY